MGNQLIFGALYMKSRIEFIDFLKGFSIFTIVVFHYAQHEVHGFLSKAVMIGGSGVHLFFIASGFALSLSTKPVTPLSFYRQRFISLLAPYYLIVLLTYCINKIYPYFDDSLYALGGHFLLYKMFDESIVGSYGYPLWFMSTIIQFYVAFPILRKLSSRMTASKFLVITLLVSCAYWVLIVMTDLSGLRIFNSFFLQYLWEFCLGMVMAKRYLTNGYVFWEQPAWRLLFFALTGIGLMAVMALFGGKAGRVLNDIPSSLGYLALCSFIYRIAVQYCSPLKKAILTIGTISYELYLSHILVLVVLQHYLVSIGLSANMLGYNMLIILPAALLLAKAFSMLNNKYLYPKLAKYR